MKKTEKEAQKKVTIDSRIKGLKNQQNAHIGRNYIARKTAEKKNKDVLIAKK